VNARLAAAFVGVLAVLVLSHPRIAEARSHDHGITKFFTDVTIAPDDVVDGDLNVVFGDANVEGVVHGDVNTLFGACTTSSTAQIDGQEHCFQNDTLRALMPWGAATFGDQDRQLFGKLASSAVVLLVFLLFPLRMRLALARVERHPALAAAAGALGAIAIFPIALILTVSIIGIPLLALEAAAIFLGLWIGQGAISLVVGRRLCELVMPTATPSPLVALIMGLVVVSAAEIVPIVGWLVTALVWLVGLGAAILSFVRSSQLDGPAPRVPIAGPPMRGWR
jgi:hypothetical protein